MENCEKCAEMFPKKRKNAQILLKSQLSAQECWKCKIVLQIRKGAEKVPSAIGTGPSCDWRILIHFVSFCIFVISRLPP